MKKNNFFGKHPIIGNLVIIILVAAIGICIVSLSLALFTKHGRSKTVPRVENMSYTEAVERLNDAGLRVEIRDSIYREDMKPGYVIEQFPKANSIVKPGRKIFLYINTVHPKEVVIDEENRPAENALKSVSMRQGIARLEELGFKNIKLVKVLGDNDCIVKITANGNVVKKMMKVPVNARIVVEVSDGRLSELRDSLQNLELGISGNSGNYFENNEESSYSGPEEYSEESQSSQSQHNSSLNQEEEEETPEFLN